MEEHFEAALSSMLEVDCLLGEDWLLVKIHEWFTYPTGDLSVHMFQSSLYDHTSKLFCLGDCDKDPLATLY